MSAGSPNLTLLREGVTKMLDVFADASKREKALQGAARDGSQRSKKEGAPKSAALQTPGFEDIKKFFFYPKYLTSKSLVELEVADGNFRKQAMIQSLILFQYLHSFTEAARAKANANLKHPNRAVLLPFRLSDADNQWISDLEARTYTEISRTPPDGEYFVKTVRTVLQTERNWVSIGWLDWFRVANLTDLRYLQALWKSELCPQFELPPLTEEASEKGIAGAKRLQQPFAPFPYKAGTAALSKLWLNESKTMQDFAKPDP
jgi:THO complex subunit 1